MGVGGNTFLYLEYFLLKSVALEDRESEAVDPLLLMDRGFSIEKDSLEDTRLRGPDLPPRGDSSGVAFLGEVGGA